MPSLLSTRADVDRMDLRSTGFWDAGRSVIVFPLLPFAPARAGLAPFAQKIEKQRLGDQSLFSPCCHLRRCRPNHETMIAASRNGIIALDIAAPSPNCPAMMAR